MMSESKTDWKALFEQWPKAMARRGILILLYGEQINFADFMTGEGFLLLSRSSPDAVGARTILVPYAQIAALKITDVVKNRVFQEIGFRGAPSHRESTTSSRSVGTR
jgi:hypothetical protein